MWKPLVSSAALLLVSGTGAQLPAQECRGFRQCYNLAADARTAGDTGLAIHAYSDACALPVERVYGALQIAACEYVISLSGATDGHASSDAYFRGRCEAGSDQACFFLGKMEAARDSLEAALALLRPLCDARFELPAVHGYTACTQLRRIAQVVEAREPEMLRTGPLQLGAFLGVLFLTLVSAAACVRALVTKSPTLATWCLASSGLALLVYGYYESGIPSHYAIRIDLLLILPALIANLVLIVIASIWLARRRGRIDVPNSTT